VWLFHWTHSYKKDSILDTGFKATPASWSMYPDGTNTYDRPDAFDSDGYDLCFYGFIPDDEVDDGWLRQDTRTPAKFYALPFQVATTFLTRYSPRPQCDPDWLASDG